MAQYILVSCRCSGLSYCNEFMYSILSAKNVSRKGHSQLILLVWIDRLISYQPKPQTYSEILMYLHIYPT